MSPQTDDRKGRIPWDDAAEWSEHALDWARKAPKAGQDLRSVLGKDWRTRHEKLPKISTFGDLATAAKFAQAWFWCQAKMMLRKSPVLDIAAYGELVWFKGEADRDPEWALQPAVFRDKYKPGGKRAEKWMLNEFCWEAPTRNAQCPREGEGASWMALAAHWHLPTRLLDWSESVIIAAWFATVEDEKSRLLRQREDAVRDLVAIRHAKEVKGLPKVQRERIGKQQDPPARECVIWALAPAVMNRMLNQGGGPIYFLSLDELVKAAFRAGKRRSRVRAVKTSQIDARMMMQQAAFTVHGGPDDLWKLAKAKNNRFLMKLVIEPKARESLARELAVMGIRRRTIYPDLLNLASDIAEDWARRVRAGGHKTKK